MEKILKLDNSSVDKLINSYDNKLLELKKIYLLSLQGKINNDIFQKIYEIYDSLNLDKDVIPISSFICQIFGSLACTNTGLKISDALIRVAATRIFSEPEQSVMELVTNSIDSYNSINNIPSIGKFGMGFFSVLYWLAQPDPTTNLFCRTMQIISKHKKENFEIELKWSEEGLILKKNKNPKKRKYEGTDIFIYANGYDFTKDQIIKMKNQIYKLFDIKTVKIEMNGEIVNRDKNLKTVKNKIHKIFNINQDLDLVTVQLENDFLFFSDNATGISEEILYNSLLIPSSSSKRNQMVHREKIISEQKLKNPEILIEGLNGNTSLHIIINSVSVVNIQIETPGESYLIYLPNDTTLPVSRDDVIYNKKEAKNLKEQLILLINNIMKTTRNLIYLFDLLEKYLITNKQHNLFKVFNEVKNEILSFNIYLIPNTKFWNLFINKFKITNYCYYKYYDKFLLNDQLYDFLLKYGNKNLFKLRICIQMDLQGDIINQELPSFLFINADLNNEKEISNLMISSSDTLLIPYKDNSFQLDRHREIISDFKRMKNSKNLIDVYLLFTMTLFKKFQNVTFINLTPASKINPIDFFDHIITLYLNLCYDDDTEEVIKFIYFLNSKISNIKLNFTYGNQEVIYCYRIGETFNSRDLENEGNIILSINKKLYKYVIDLFPEETSIKCYLKFIQHFIAGAHFFYSKTKKDFEKVSKNCVTNEELFIFTNVSRYFIKKYLDKSAQYTGVFTFILSEIRRNYSNDTLANILRLYIRDDANGISLFNFITEKNLYLSVDEFYNNLNNENLLEIPKIDSKHVFSCKSLLSYLYSFDDDFSEPLRFFKSISENYKTYDIEKTKLQIVEIAVNEGTTKNFIQAVITELYQNSVDAIKSSGEKNKDIYIETANNGIRIMDFVGIKDLKNLITLLIPFLSSKDPNSPDTVGEMGTGFFNVYRQPYVKNVYILTNGIKIKCTPLHEDNVVYDILYEIEMFEFPGNYTEITLILNDNMPEIINDANVFVNTNLGFEINKKCEIDIDLINKSQGSGKGALLKKDLIEICDKFKILYKKKDKKIDLIKEINNKYNEICGDINISLNAKDISKKLKSVYRIKGVGEVFYVSNKIPSLVLTNNSPFSSLFNFLSDFPEVYKAFKNSSEVSVIINLDKDIYTADQSRTKVNIKDRNKVIDLINNGLYLFNLYLYTNKLSENPNEIIQFTTSRSNISQVKIFDSGNNFANFNTFNDNLKNFEVYNEYDLKSLIGNYSINNIFLKLSYIINQLVSRFHMVHFERILNILDVLGSDKKNEEKSREIYNSFISKKNINIPYDNDYDNEIVSYDLGLLINSITIWFSIKDTSKQKEEKIIVVKKSGEKLDTKNEKLDIKDIKEEWPILQVFINIFWKKLDQLINEGELILQNFVSEPPKIFSGNSANGSLGFYMRENHSLVLNVKNYNPTLLLNSLVKIKKLNIEQSILLLQTDKEIIKYFASNMVTTLIHEIGHAIQGSNHSGSSHGMTNIKFKNGQFLEFDDMCLNIYRKIISMGLFYEFIEKLKKYTK